MKESITIKLVLFDVDGVLTDGSLYFDGTGEIIKSFSARDGVAFALLKEKGFQVGILSGKKSAALGQRCLELGIGITLMGIHNKLDAFNRLIDRLKIKPSEVVFVGDDVNDIQVLEAVGHSYAPSDSHPLVQLTVKNLCKTKGGQGVAREVAEDILLKSGLTKEQIYSSYLTTKETKNFLQ